MTFQEHSSLDCAVRGPRGLRALRLSTPLCAAAFLALGCEPTAYVHGPERTTDDDEVALVRQVPGYGGQFIEGCDYIVHLTDPATQAAAARAHFEPVVAAMGTNSPYFAPECSVSPRLILRKARYDFAQLGEWHQRIMPVVLAAFAVVSTDIDERRNRIVIRVRSRAAKWRAGAALAVVGIPREAVIIDVKP